MPRLFASPIAPMCVDGVRQEVNGLKKQAMQMHGVTGNPVLQQAVNDLDALIDELDAIGIAHQAGTPPASPHRL